MKFQDIKEGEYYYINWGSNYPFLAKERVVRIIDEDNIVTEINSHHHITALVDFVRKCNKNDDLYRPKR